MRSSINRSVRFTTALIIAAVAVAACDVSPVAPAAPSAPRPQLLALKTTAAPAMIGTYLGHTCGLKADGTLVCWGRNNYGQATAPAGLADVAQVTVGYHHTCTLKTDGTVVCWGSNYNGKASVPAGLAGVAPGECRG